jgi:hypothetical protein
MTKIHLLPEPRYINNYGKLLDSSVLNKIHQEIKPDIISHPEGYRLTIGTDGVELIANDRAGAFYARQTLEQIAQQCTNEVPQTTIDDYPDFPVRGVLLDISRDRVPTMDYLFKLIELLASLKINQLQLYMEHTFAYTRHAEVSADASPLTAEEIRTLDKYCTERFIELVPCQNSFGHMSRWLKHDRYRQLAECPDGAGDKWILWGNDPEPFSLCPTDEGCLELLDDMYSELLPNFSSQNFNVGCDETFDLGLGRSRELCEKVGKGRVFLSFIQKIEQLTRKHGRKMTMFADIVNKYPELISEIPPEITLLDWGYGQGYDFNSHCQAYKKAGLGFQLLSSNSTYCSVAGRTERGIENILNTAINGLKYGASGLLISEWGNCGHLQPPSIALTGFAMHAAVSWCLNANQFIDLSKLTSRFVFHDKNLVAGKLAYDLGNCYLLSKGIYDNSNLFLLLLHFENSRFESPFSEFTHRGLQKVKEETVRLKRLLSQSDIQTVDHDLIKAELEFAIDYLFWAAEVAETLLASRAEYISELGPEKNHLLTGLNKLIKTHTRIWPECSRSGGFEDSLKLFRKAKNILENII